MGVKDNALFLLSLCPAHICVSIINDVGLLGPAPAKHFNKARGVMRSQVKLSLGCLCPPQQQIPRGPFLENPIFNIQNTTQPLMGTKASSRPESGMGKKHFCKFSSEDAARVDAGTM